MQFLIHARRCQRAEVDALSLSDIKMHNVADLTFSLWPLGEDKHSRSKLIIYRQGLIDLLMHNMMNSDFVIYSLATYENAISIAITIEFYVNFVFRLSHWTAQAKEFKFRTVIARLPNKMHKSIGIMHQILNVAEYSNVYVIDDLFDGLQAVWSKAIPSNLLKHGVKFFAFNIPQYWRPSGPVKNPTIYVSMFILCRCAQIRENDEVLHRVNISQTVPMRGQAHWNLFGLKQHKLKGELVYC